MATETRKYEKKARAEGERQTRERIIEATMELHEEVGPAKTTVAEIARRAGVQRLTVYNHFPEEIELFGACQAQWMELHPLPDFAGLLGRPEPDERLRGVLGALYAWYGETEPMAEKIYRDRGGIPALDQLVAQTADRNFAELAEALAAGFEARGARAKRVRALIRLALDFWTWRRLDREGLGDKAAAQLVTGAVSAAATG
jgi:AcrR family transcriptional regulator